MKNISIKVLEDIVVKDKGKFFVDAEDFSLNKKDVVEFIFCKKKYKGKVINFVGRDNSMAQLSIIL